MTEDGQYGLQISGRINGDLVVVRGKDADELSENIAGLTKNGEDLIKNWSDFKELAILKGVFTGEATGSNTNNGRKPRANDAAPSSGGTPTCNHGTMKDLAGKGYKHRYYCPAPKGETQCQARD